MSCRSHHHCWDFNSKQAKKSIGSFSWGLGRVRPTRKQLQGNYSCFILFVIVVIFSIKVSQSEQGVGEAWRGHLRALSCVRRVCAEGPGTSVVPRSSFLHAGGFGFGDVLVVGLVLQFPAEVLDCFIQAFFQRHLQTHKHGHKESGDGRHGHGVEPRLLAGAGR